MTTSSLLTPLDLSARFRSARCRTTTLCEPLTPEDMMVQSLPEASPAKWHLAHTAWFFESFVLREFLPGYRLFNADFSWLFNSYYQSFAHFPEKRLRSSFSRPGLDEILRYRQHVDEGVGRLMSGDPDAEALRRIELGVNHEEQHQELLLTDILNAFFTNPLRPAYLPDAPRADQDKTISSRDAEIFEGTTGGRIAQTNGGANRNALTGTNESPAPMRFLRFDGSLVEIGSDGQIFCYDNELPRHRAWLEPFAIGDRLVTCGEFAEFMEDGGYRKPELWLSDGWIAVQANGWRAPLYWTSESGDWSLFTLRGELPLAKMKNAPVSHISFYEADAYARWAGRRLPTEFEWEAGAAGQPVAGNLLDSGLLRPSASLDQNKDVTKWFGDCWVWTASAYLGYPGFQPLPGTLGEYNGKFMSGQMVLRGGSCATPAAHIRATYRNFFPPETRWQFSGIRLAAL